MGRPRRLTLVVVLFALGFAGLAQAARHCRPCHPDLSGTRVLTISGDVTGYSFVGGTIAVRRAPARGCASKLGWAFASRQRTRAVSGACERSAWRNRTVLVRYEAAQGDRVVRVRLAPASVDRPDRLDVFDRATGRRIASWPLIERPARVALYDDIAILSGSTRSALYALRITDGRIALIGIVRRADRPVIGRDGVVYADDLDVSKHRAAPRQSILKLLPIGTVNSELVRVGRPIRTSRINAMSMDGPRVAFVADDPHGLCDRVLFWNIPWHFVSRLTQRSGATCLARHAAGGITQVTIAGSRAAWTTAYGGETRILAASIIKCEEWVSARPTVGRQRVAGLSGDGGVLAYAVGDVATGRAQSEIGMVPRRWRGYQLQQVRDRVLGLSVDEGRIATVYDDGLAMVVTRAGRLIARFSVGDARAFSFRRNTLAVLERDALKLYDVRSGRVVRSWRVAERATSVDLQFGLALIAAGRDVLALNVKTGRTAVLFHAPAPVSVQLEAPGAAIQFNAHGHGYLRFAPMSAIEAGTHAQ